MDENLLKLIYSVVGGGIAAVAFKLIEKYWIGFRLSENIEAKKKLKYYAKVFWFHFHELSLRLSHIQAKMESKNPSEMSALKYPLDNASVEWFTKQGYYAASTAYLIAASSAWINVLQREIVFLEFSKKSVTADFFRRLEDYKRKVSGKGSILWYHYFNGIGERLIDPKTKRPITFAAFVELLATEPKFKEFYDQLFRFLDDLAHLNHSQHPALLASVIECLDELKDFLSQRAKIPKI